MELTGTLVYDPAARAKGKDRARIIRRHAHELASLARTYVPHLDGKSRKCANVLDHLLADDPHYWLRRKGQVSTAGKLNQLLQHARGLLGRTEYPEIQQELAAKLQLVDNQLVLTRKDPGWVILQVGLDSVEPYLDQIRADGTKIGCSVWGPHISVIRGEVQGFKTSHLYANNGRTVTIEVGSEIKQNRKGYYWLNAQSVELEKLRTDLGLPPRPRPPFHLTIGKSC